MEPIKLINGGAFTPMDLTAFSNPAHRTDPSVLPDLPAGITLKDLNDTVLSHAHPETTADPETTKLLWEEIQVRTFGYLPQFGPDNRDQFGYDRSGFDSDGRDHWGFTPEERAADPMLQDVVRPPKYGRTTGAPVKENRHLNVHNRGNVKGQIIKAVDQTDRSLHECWRDFFVYNETVPIQDRLDDSEIAQRMREMFPEQESKRIKDVKTMRQWYNRGSLSCQKGKPPALKSHRYLYNSPSGRIYQINARGSVIQEWDLKPLLLGRASEEL